MPTVQELYELWAGDSELRQELEQSLEPRGSDRLFELFAALRPQPGQVVADVGARDGRHAIRLAREHALRAVAIDPLPLHTALARAAAADAGVEVDVREGSAEALPLADASVDWIWCRDVLSHVPVRPALAEFARVLKPGGAAVVYATVPTARLEPREAAELADAAALTLEDAEQVGAAAAAAGLALRSVERIGAEWRERMLETGEWRADDDLLALARLARGRERLSARYGAPAVAAAWGGLVWGPYQLLGKLCPTVWVWDRRA